MTIYKSGKHLIAETSLPNDKKVVSFVNRHQADERELINIHNETLIQEIHRAPEEKFPLPVKPCRVERLTIEGLRKRFIERMKIAHGLTKEKVN